MGAGLNPLRPIEYSNAVLTLFPSDFCYGRGHVSEHCLTASLQRIHSAIGGDISVTELAREAGMSRSGFFEKFRREIGCSPMEYVTDWRMAIAKTLLRQGKHTNTEIALKVGYGSASAFGMAFARQVGLSPRTFQKQYS